MKKILFIALLFTTALSYGQNVSFRVTNADPVTGKRIVYTSLQVTFTNGAPTEFVGLLSYRESNDSPALPNGTTLAQKRAVESYSESYTCANKYINGSTLVYVSDSDPNAVRLDEWLRTRTVGSLPGTGGGDILSGFIQGLCKQMILIRKANGEFVD